MSYSIPTIVCALMLGASLSFPVHAQEAEPITITSVTALSSRLAQIRLSQPIQSVSLNINGGEIRRADIENNTVTAILSSALSGASGDIAAIDGTVQDQNGTTWEIHEVVDVTDAVAPRIVSSSMSSKQEVTIEWNEPLNMSAGFRPQSSNFTVYRLEQRERLIITITDLSIMNDRTVRLALAEEVEPGKPIYLEIEANIPLRDTTGNRFNNGAAHTQTIQNPASVSLQAPSADSSSFGTFLIAADSTSGEKTSSGGRSSRSSHPKLPSDSANTVKAPPLPSAVLGTSTFQFTRSFGLYAKGNEIKELQERLTKEKFYAGYVYGYFDRATQQAVRLFQMKFKIPATGFVGPLTIAKLNAATK